LACLSRGGDSGYASGIKNERDSGVPQVFISYARSDKRRVAKLVNALRKAGFQPWWDDDIQPGASWEQTIEKALAEAQAVIVCWSPPSVASENVRSEARVARSRGRLVQIFLEPCDPPLFFGERQGIDLSDWNGSAAHPGAKRLKQALEDILSKRAPVSDPTPVRKRSGWKLTPVVAASALALFAIVTAGGWRWEKAAHARGPARVAVQPVEALGGGTSTPSFAEGLTDQILSSLSDGHIPTISRTDSQSLKNGDVEAKLNSLGADYTLGGTVEQRGDTLHARLHLDDRRRHSSLWSYEASGLVNDPATLNSSVARAMAGVITCAYRALDHGLADTELLSRYLRVCDLFVNHDDASDAKSTFELLGDLRLIMAKAPAFAPAQSDFAKFAAYLAPTMPADQMQGVRTEAARAAKRALELDPHSADAYVAQAMLLAPTDWARREALLRKAVAVAPDWPHANGFLAMLLTETGRMREAAVYGQRAAAADLQIDWKPFGAKMACDAGQTGGVIPEVRERVSNSPGDAALKWTLRWCLLDAGQFREAQSTEDPAAIGTQSASALRQAVEQALISGKPSDRTKALQLGSKVAASEPSLRTFVSVWSSALGDTDMAFRLLENFRPGYATTGITDFLFFPQTESLRRDPRFFGLMKRYGLAQFWQSTGRWPDFCAGPRLAACRAAVAKQLAQR
jgi:TolB-like protein